LVQHLRVRIFKGRGEVEMIYLFVGVAGLIAGLLLAPKPGKENVKCSKSALARSEIS